MKNVIRGCLIISILLVFTPKAFAAQGLRLGVGAGVSVPNIDGDMIDKDETYTGLALNFIEIGYGFTDAASVNFRLAGASSALTSIASLGMVDGWSFTEYALDFRWAFLTDKSFNPFLMGGVGVSKFYYESGWLNDMFGVDFELESDYTLGFDVGGGFNYYLGSKQRWSLGALFYYHFVSYQNTHVDYDSSNSIWSVNDDDITTDDKIDGGIAMFLFTLSYTWRK